MFPSLSDLLVFALLIFGSVRIFFWLLLAADKAFEYFEEIPREINKQSQRKKVIAENYKRLRSEFARKGVGDLRALFHLERAEVILRSLEESDEVYGSGLRLDKIKQDSSRCEQNRLLKIHASLLALADDFLSLAEDAARFPLCGAKRYHKIVQTLDREIQERDYLSARKPIGDSFEFRLLERAMGAVMWVLQGYVADAGDEALERLCEIALGLYDDVDRLRSKTGSCRSRWGNQIEEHARLFQEYGQTLDDAKILQHFAQVAKEIEATPCRIRNREEPDVLSANDDAVNNLKNAIHRFKNSKPIPEKTA
ncbi:MAG: hypothetical protein K2X27_13970 [Candidatus Obscuribacterales bacterium]|nr:hypothetical protein [Candidatus Obscuribacterales bacterium]